MKSWPGISGHDFIPDSLFSVQETVPENGKSQAHGKERLAGEPDRLVDQDILQTGSVALEELAAGQQILDVC